MGGERGGAVAATPCAGDWVCREFSGTPSRRGCDASVTSPAASLRLLSLSGGPP